MIKINKQLQRPDGGTVSGGSLLSYSLKTDGENKTLIYFLKHHFSQSALDEKKPLINGVTNFGYAIRKVCEQVEWDELNNNAGAGLLVETWLKEAIDEVIGVGSTEII